MVALRKVLAVMDAPAVKRMAHSGRRSSADVNLSRAGRRGRHCCEVVHDVGNHDRSPAGLVEAQAPQAMHPPTWLPVKPPPPIRASSGEATNSPHHQHQRIEAWSWLSRR